MGVDQRERLGAEDGLRGEWERPVCPTARALVGAKDGAGGALEVLLAGRGRVEVRLCGRGAVSGAKREARGAGAERAAHRSSCRGPAKRGARV